MDIIKHQYPHKRAYGQFIQVFFSVVCVNGVDLSNISDNIALILSMKSGINSEISFIFFLSIDIIGLYPSSDEC